MYEKVLLAVDGSEQAKAAAQTANNFIKSGLIKKLVIFNATQDFVGNYGMDSIHIDEINQIAKKAGQQMVKDIRAMIQGDVEITEKVVLGDPSHAICEEAKESGCDMIIMGSRGKNPVSGLLLGSVSMRVLQFANCPVLIVKK